MKEKLLGVGAMTSPAGNAEGSNELSKVEENKGKDQRKTMPNLKLQN